MALGVPTPGVRVYGDTTKPQVKEQSNIGKYGARYPFPPLVVSSPVGMPSILQCASAIAKTFAQVASGGQPHPPAIAAKHGTDGDEPGSGKPRFVSEDDMGAGRSLPIGHPDGLAPTDKEDESRSGADPCCRVR